MPTSKSETFGDLYPEGRPEHPDFWKLSAIVMEHDREADLGRFGATFKADVASIGYMAHQRALRAKQLLEMDEDGNPIPESDRLVMMWLDAFTAGQQFGARHGLNDQLPQVDGNRRQRRGRK